VRTYSNFSPNNRQAAILRKQGPLHRDALALHGLALLSFDFLKVPPLLAVWRGGLSNLILYNINDKKKMFLRLINVGIIKWIICF
jgi:hypothetical protein